MVLTLPTCPPKSSLPKPTAHLTTATASAKITNLKSGKHQGDYPAALLDSHLPRSPGTTLVCHYCIFFTLRPVGGSGLPCPLTISHPEPMPSHLSAGWARWVVLPQVSLPPHPLCPVARVSSTPSTSCWQSLSDPRTAPTAQLCPPHCQTGVTLPVCLSPVGPVSARPPHLAYLGRPLHCHLHGGQTYVRTSAYCSS